MGDGLPMYGNRVAGRWRPADDGQVTLVMAPHTGEAIGEVALSARTDVDRAVEAAYAAFEEHDAPWRHTTPARRAEALTEIADAVEQHDEMFVELEVAQTGKLVKDVRDVELPHIVDTLRFFAGAARTRTFPSGHFIDGTTSRVVPAAVGVVGVILPWNYPLMMAAWKLGPILAAGCTAVFKPDPKTPLTTLLLSELCEDILPPGTINVTAGDAQTGAELASHPGVHMVTLTGSQRAGRQVAALTAGCLKRTHLELGGNAPVIVDGMSLGPGELASAASSLADTIVFNAGQSCAAPCRIYVTGPSSAYDELVEQLAWALDGRQPGLPHDESADYGAIISPTQMHAVQSLIAGAGGENACRSDRPLPTELGDGNFMRPAVIFDAPRDSVAERQELFGPAVTVHHVRDPQDAVGRANAYPYALAGSVWSTNRRFIHDVATRLNAGEVWINTHLEQSPELPHSGTRGSGHGTDLSAAAIDDFCYLKSMTERL